MKLSDESEKRCKNSDNFGEVNIESLKKCTIPEKAYRMIEANHGAGVTVKRPSKEALAKNAEMLLDD